LNSKLKIQNSKLQKLVPLLLNWFSANARDLPWRKSRDPYAIWVSEIMLQQTQVKTVIPFWNRWMKELPTIESAANASTDKIHKLWEGLGYYTRARNLQKAAQQIMQNGKQKAQSEKIKFPETFEKILELPGIGRYTAGAICSIAFNQPTPILDGNVIRVLTRIFGIAENPKEKETNQWLWNLAEQLVSRAKNAKTKANKSSRPSRISRETNSYSHLNQSLMELGALICTPRNPQCSICPVKKCCVALKEKRVEELPNLGKRTTATVRHFIAFAIEQNGKFLVQQRPAGIVNAHLWEFPNFEINGSKLSPQEIFQKQFAVEPLQLQPLCKLKHSITRYRITLQAFHARSRKNSKRFEGKWLTPSEFEALAFTAAHKKLASFTANCMLTRS
jgi:A/G-specific adenine glycosylase